MSGFAALEVAEVERLTDDAVAVTFAVPDDLRDDYDFAAGQSLTLRRVVDGVEHRRTYSICAPVGARPRIGVREIPGGLFSSWLVHQVRPGDRVEVQPPSGSFRADPTAGGRHLCVAAGSGITPMLSIAASLLGSGDAEVTLVETEPNYAKVSARLLLDKLRREALSFVHGRPEQATQAEMGERYGDYFRAYVKTGIANEAAFADEVKADPYADVPADQLLTALRGKDVIFTFVESYGRNAVEAPSLPAGTTAVLTDGDAKLKEAGLVRDRRAGVSSYYRYNSEIDPRENALLVALKEGVDDALPLAGEVGHHELEGLPPRVHHEEEVVVDEQGANSHAVPVRGAGGSGMSAAVGEGGGRSADCVSRVGAASYGISMITVKPPSGGLRISKR